MYFTDCESLREMERLMRNPPYYKPRGHGMAVVDPPSYTAKDCDCRLCLHFAGHGRSVWCSLNRCPYLPERITAGVATTQEVLTETMSAIHNQPFRKRLTQHLKESELTKMDFRNENHRVAFAEAIRKKNTRDYALMAALYLLTADHFLWRTAKRYITSTGIPYGQMRLQGLSEDGYALLCAAKDLHLGTKHLTICDLADASLISKQVFGLVCNAMAIRRFGLGAVHFCEKGGM